MFFWLVVVLVMFFMISMAVVLGRARRAWRWLWMWGRRRWRQVRWWRRRWIDVIVVNNHSWSHHYRGLNRDDCWCHHYSRRRLNDCGRLLRHHHDFRLYINRLAAAQGYSQYYPPTNLHRSSP